MAQMLRSGCYARTYQSDDIWVSGVLGDAMLGCRLVTSDPILPAPNGSELFAYETAYWRPEPCFKYKPILTRYATASADVSFGDDYGVVFSARAKDRQAIFDSARQAKLKLTLIGSILAGAGVACLDVDGEPMDWPEMGYRHK